MDQPLYVAFLAYFYSIVAQSSQFSVSWQAETVTRFEMVGQGNVGLLAHESLSGAAFEDLTVGDRITLLYADRLAFYQVSETPRYLATDPYSLYSQFVALADGSVHSSAGLYDAIFETFDGRLVLQTCFDGARGRLFVIARPIEHALEQQAGE